MTLWRLTFFAVCTALASLAHAQSPGQEIGPPAVTGPKPPPPPVPAEKPRRGWAGLPIVTYSPETELGLGAFGTHFFRVDDAPGNERPSSLSVVGLYTLRSQLIVELIPELYWNADRTHLWSRFDVRRYPNKLWEIGGRAPEASEESYSEQRWRWQGRIGQSIAGPLFLYGHLEMIHMDIFDFEPGGLIARRAVPGAAGGFTLALGAGLAWDTRDHLLSPHEGAFYDVVLTSSQPAFGSEYEFTTMVFDLRRYVPIAAEHTLAGNLYVAIQDGEAPFYQLPQLGGADLLRGYFEGRFRDKTLALVQAEYRFPLFWRFGGVAFAGVGGVGRTFGELDASAPKWSVGTGLRVMLNRDERLNLRADVGFGRDAFGFYVNVGEVF